MFLNTLNNENRKTKKRVGRGMGSGFGKTCGRGHKGQKSRSGGFSKIGFEGGQMPLQRRLPKSGFSSRISRVTSEVTLKELDKINETEINLDVLKKYNLINKNIQRAKIIASGELTKALTITGIKATKGARVQIEKLKGTIEE